MKVLARQAAVFAGLVGDRLFALGILVAAILLAPVGLAAGVLLTPWYALREAVASRRHRRAVAARRCPGCGRAYGADTVSAAFAAARSARRAQIRELIGRGAKPRLGPMRADLRCPACGRTETAAVR